MSKPNIDKIIQKKFYRAVQHYCKNFSCEHNYNKESVCRNHTVMLNENGICVGCDTIEKLNDFYGKKDKAKQDKWIHGTKRNKYIKK